MLTMAEKEQMATENYRLIHYFAHKYKNTQIEYEDLFSAASLGMTKALNTFDASKGIKFTSYAGRCMTNEILMLVRSSKKHLNVLSLDKPHVKDKKGNVQTLTDILIAPEKDMEIGQVINQVLQRLNERKRMIMDLFFEGKERKKIALIVGVTDRYICRVIKDELASIKKEYWRGEKTSG